ncbi:transposase [Streptosporangium sp. NPDC000396]|uniref:transposase n=1 Tax=Streptosporangium sp. NPDC000396 TaxID=3366185 RepID=UPI0036852FCA
MSAASRPFGKHVTKTHALESLVIAAIEQVFPAALRQRCLIHRLRNVMAKTPAGMQAEIRDSYWVVFDTSDLKTEPGPQLVELIDHRLSEFIDRYRATYPAA